MRWRASRAPIYAVIPVKDRIEYTRPLVEALLAEGELSGLYLADNGSTDGTAEWAEAIAKVDERLHVAAHPESGIHTMWNAGLDWATSQDPRARVALLNNDLSVEPRFLPTLAEALRDDRIGVVGANYDGRSARNGADYQAVRSLCAGRYDGTGGLPGFAMMIRAEDGYRFPESLRWWYGDTDLLFTVLSEGRLAVIAIEARCEHLDGGGRTGNWSDPAMQEVLRKDREAFQAKWRLD